MAQGLVLTGIFLSGKMRSTVLPFRVFKVLKIKRSPLN